MFVSVLSDSVLYDCLFCVVCLSVLYASLFLCSKFVYFRVVCLSVSGCLCWHCMFVCFLIIIPLATSCLLSCLSVCHYCNYRIGFIGNPSDGFYGKTISLSISNFWADVTIMESPKLVSLEGWVYMTIEHYSNFIQKRKHRILPPKGSFLPKNLWTM